MIDKFWLDEFQKDELLDSISELRLKAESFETIEICDKLKEKIGAIEGQKIFAKKSEKDAEKPLNVS